MEETQRWTFAFLVVSSWMVVAVTALSSSPSSTTTSVTSLGLDALRHLVLDAARSDEASSLDLSGILWLEHVNLVVGSKTLAEHFYKEFLGLTRDPNASFHVNLGLQQFHLAETGDPAQRVTGSLGLVVPSVATIRQRIPAALETLAGTLFDIVDDDSEEYITLTCPWGNRLYLYDAAVDAHRQESVTDSPHKMVK